MRSPTRGSLSTAEPGGRLLARHPFVEEAQ